MASQPGVRGEELSTPPESKRFQLPCWRRGVKSHRRSGGIWLRSLQEAGGGLQTPVYSTPLPTFWLYLCQLLLRAGTWPCHPYPAPAASLRASARAVARASAVLFPAPAECQHPPGAAAEWDGRHSHKTAKKPIRFPFWYHKVGKNIFS